MCKKYIVLLCFTIYYIPAASTVGEKYCNNSKTYYRPDKMEIKMLWYALIGDIDYISYENLCNIYEDEDPNELREVMVKYGTRIEHTDGDDEYKMTFENFTKAVSDGRIQRWSKQAMNHSFNEIIPKGEIRNYVTPNDMISHYGFNCASQIENVMINYGKPHLGEYRLYFFGFRIAVNIGQLPTPVCNENASLTALFTEFYKIIPNRKFNYHITNKDLIKYYETDLKNVVTEYGEWHYVEYILYLENFKNAIISGHLPLLLCCELSLTEIESIFNEILSKNEALNYITHSDLIEYYKQQLDHIISIYGGWHSHYEEPKLNFSNFRKAVISGDLPIPMRKKNTIQCGR